MTYVTINTVHELSVKLVDEAISIAGNAWRLSKLCGINHCTLINLKKHPNRVLNGRHFIAIIRFLGTEKSIETIISYPECSVGEFIEEKKELSQRIKNRKVTSNGKSKPKLKLKKIPRNKETDCATGEGSEPYQEGNQDEPTVRYPRIR